MLRIYFLSLLITAELDVRMESEKVKRLLRNPAKVIFSQICLMLNFLLGVFMLTSQQSCLSAIY